MLTVNSDERPLDLASKTIEFQGLLDGGGAEHDAQSLRSLASPRDSQLNSPVSQRVVQSAAPTLGKPHNIFTRLLGLLTKQRDLSHLKGIFCGLGSTRFLTVIIDIRESLSTNFWLPKLRVQCRYSLLCILEDIAHRHFSSSDRGGTFGEYYSPVHPYS